MYKATSEALTAVLPKIQVFWAVTPYRFVNNYRSFEETQRPIRDDEGILLHTESDFIAFSK